MTTSSDRVYRELRRLILSGEIGMGARLGEAHLATTLNTSRTPIREAIRRLEADGLVDVESNRGAQVAFWTADDFNEIFALRALLEGHGAALAAVAITDEQIGELDGLCDDMEALIARRHVLGVGRLNELNHEFHRRILEASGYSRLSSLVSSVVLLPLARQTFDRYSDEAIERSSHHHRELIAALRARSPAWARATMEAHIEAARAEVSSWSKGGVAQAAPEIGTSPLPNSRAATRGTSAHDGLDTTDNNR